mmetsp:Transcript_59957/g.111165  ORF Transcript_59957/g.111165 Transcript_59957/m.111165 type:complete len:446 (-) Transcript_59957:63-1400(-)
MHFTAVQKIGLARWSPNGKLFAATDRNRLLIRDSASLRLVQVYVCVDKVTRLEWSAASVLVLCEVARAGIVQIWHVTESAWQCRIDEGLAGLAFASFSPSASHVFVTAEYQLHMSVWAVQGQSPPLRIRFPKFAGRGLAFTEDQRWFALLRRLDCRDRVAVHTIAADFSKVADFGVSGDFEDVVWIQSGAKLSLLLWERPASAPRLVWYSLGGEMVGQVEHCGLLRSAILAPSARMLAVGCIDGQIHLVGTAAQKVLAKFEHNLPACIAVDDEVSVLRQSQEASAYEHSNAASTKVLVEKSSAEACKVDSDGTPCIGVANMLWSPDERYLATQHEAMPSAVWIWDIGQLRLHTLLLHDTSVRSISWDPTLHNGPRLAVSTSGPQLFLWAAEGGAVALQAPLTMARLLWCSDGSKLLLQEGSRGCFASEAWSGLASAAFAEEVDLS